MCLAGDAAHVHSVNGGQGLNTGIADAFALAWRLGYIVGRPRLLLAPGADIKLLRSYDTERRAVAQGVIDVASRLVRDTMHTAEQYVKTIEKNASYITGMGVTYDWVGSELIQEPAAGARPDIPACWTAGRRCPDVQLVAAEDGRASRIYSLAEYGKYIIFLFGEANLETDTTTWPGAANATFYKVLPTGSPVLPQSGKGTYSVVGPVLGESDSFVVVVRPDMYIGFVGEADGWKSYLAEVLA